MNTWQDIEITTGGEAFHLVELAAESGMCAVDTETTGLFWAIGDRPFMATFCPDVQHAYACYNPEIVKSILAGMHKRGVKMLFHNAAFDFHMLRSWPGCEWRPNPDYASVSFEDTMHAFRIAFPGTPADLKTAAKRYCEGIDVAGPQSAVRSWIAANTTTEKIAGKRVKQVPTFDKVPRDIMLPYATQDVVMTLMCWNGLEAELKSREKPSRLPDHVPTLWQAYRDEIGTTAEVVDMERVGVPVDRQRLFSGIQRASSEIESLTKEWLGGPFADVSPTSHTQIRKLLYETLGEPVKHKTKASKSAPDGLPSTSEAALVDMETEGGQYAAEVLLPIRGWKKYLERVQEVEAFLGQDGRLHSSFKGDRARTGRFSSVEPALQNWTRPQPSKPHTMVRDIVVAQPGREFLFGDFSQIELRLAAHFMNDIEMIHLLATGEDIHKRTAAMMYGISIEEVTKDQRAIAKIMNFSILYGAGVRRVTETLRYGAAGTDPLTIEEVHSALFLLTGNRFENKNDIEPALNALLGDKYFGQLIADEGLEKMGGAEYVLLAAYMLDAYHSAQPLVKKFLKQAQENAKKFGGIYTWFGLFIDLTPQWSEALSKWLTYDHKAGNALIQGTAAGLMKETIRRAAKVCREFCAQRGLVMWEDVKIILTIHDELAYDVKKGLAYDLAKALDPPLSVWPSFNIPIKLDWAMVPEGQSWAYKTDIACGHKGCPRYKTLCDEHSLLELAA